MLYELEIKVNIVSKLFFVVKYIDNNEEDLVYIIHNTNRCSS